MVVIHRNESELGLGYEKPDRTVTVAVDPARELIPKKFEYDLYNLDVKYDFGASASCSAPLRTSITTHRLSVLVHRRTRDGLRGRARGHRRRRTRRREQFTQEIRLLIAGEGPFNWTFGALLPRCSTSADCVLRHAVRRRATIPTPIYYRRRFVRVVCVVRAMFRTASATVWRSAPACATSRTTRKTTTTGFGDDPRTSRRSRRPASTRSTRASYASLQDPGQRQRVRKRRAAASAAAVSTAARCPTTSRSNS